MVQIQAIHLWHVDRLEGYRLVALEISPEPPVLPVVVIPSCSLVELRVRPAESTLHLYSIIAYMSFHLLVLLYLL